MKFNSKRNSKKSDALATAKNNLWQKFEQANLRLQYKCANWLERKTAHFTRLNWILILLCFTVFTSSCSIYLIVRSFSANKTGNIRVIPITKPTNAVSLKDKPPELNEVISKKEFEKITSFRNYMDSLGRSPTGKKTYDSIVSDRPGLLDSLTIIENYYYSHLKN
ncbi:hypothetical protein [Flavobacterium chungangense]|uniref:Uncharacterized protein n=1 Tax=Flavobacterium chungangense TaxID=554283 RepID=A0A6V6YZD3_9FLAO|nr:hypothetical protein [Flavobacterium chungangense]CAD0004851.1 hypothetical protein FLACHUCJ7_02069 [Flavobacterium chungangense]